MDAEWFYRLVESRRSVRRFRPEAPAREVVERLLSAAVAAPSASNKQPWRFVVVARGETTRRMAEAVRAAVDRIARAVEPAFEPSFRAYGDYFTRFEDAPLVVVVLFRPMTLLSHMTGGRLEAGDQAAVGAMERDSGLASTALAIENLLLAAHAEGLGASGMTGPLVAANDLRKILDVPPGWEFAALVPLGHPDEDPSPTTRKPADKVTRWIA